MTLENGIDVKNLSAMLGHVSAATTLDICTHATDAMQKKAAVNINRGIGKKTDNEDEESPADRQPPTVINTTLFVPYQGKMRKPGTGCLTRINDHLWEGRYFPVWPDGKKHSRNVYAHIREECEEKLKVLIIEVKTELAELNRQQVERTLPLQDPGEGQEESKEGKGE